MNSKFEKYFETYEIASLYVCNIKLYICNKTMNAKLIIVAIILSLTSCKSVKKVTSSSEIHDTYSSQSGVTITDSIKSIISTKYIVENVTDSSFTVEITDYVLIKDTVSGNTLSLPKTTSKVIKTYSNKIISSDSKESNYSKNHIEIDTTKIDSTNFTLEKVDTKIKKDSTAIVRAGYLLLALVIIAYGILRKYFPSIFVKVKQFIKL